MKQDDKLIELAIQDLSLQTRFPEAIKMIAEVIDHQKITSETWENWLNNQIINQDITQPNYSEILSRIITLKAIILPQTTPTLLNWLNLHPNQQFYKSSFEFQQRFYYHYQKVASHKNSCLLSHLSQGVNYLLKEVFNQNVTPQSVAIFLNHQQSIWKNCLPALVNNFINDLDYIANHLEPLEKLTKNDLVDQNQRLYFQEFFYSDYEFWLPLIKSQNKSPLPCYFAFAKLFELLKQNRISAYFYQISQGKAPNKIFKSAFGKRRYELYLGLLIYREIPWLEKVRNPHVVLNTISVFLTGAGLMFLFATLKSFNATEAKTSQTFAQKEQSNLIFENHYQSREKPKIEQNLSSQTGKSLDSFSPNKQAIKKIVDELIPEISLKYNLPQKSGTHNAYYQIITTLKETLKISGAMSYSGVIEGEWTITTETLSEQEEKWFAKIIHYQQDLPNFYGKYGMIDQITMNQLKHDIREKIEARLSLEK
jgi:hypothetical protein